MLITPANSMSDTLALVGRMRELADYRALAQQRRWQERAVLWEAGMVASALFEDQPILAVIQADWGRGDGLPGPGMRQFLMAVEPMSRSARWVLDAQATRCGPWEGEALERLLQGREILAQILGQQDDQITAVFRRGAVEAYVSEHLSPSAHTAIAAAWMDIHTAAANGNNRSGRL